MIALFGDVVTGVGLSMYDSVWMYVSFLLNGQTTDSVYGWMSSLATRERGQRDSELDSVLEHFGCFV